MSQIHIEHGTAEVTATGVEMSKVSGEMFVSYLPRDLMDATAAALLAVNTPQAVTWAHEIFKLTGDAPR
jgi:hypothetical protein